MMNFISAGSILSGLSVILGAFGTHSLRDHFAPDLMRIYETGTQYLFMHSIALIFYGLWRQTISDSLVKAWPPYFFLTGSFIFTGSLYLITFTGIRVFGAITPIGGLLLITAWIGFGIQAHQHRKK